MTTDETPDHGLDVEPTYGAPVTVSGRIDVDRFPGGKRFQGVWLHGAGGGGSYVLAYRPVERLLPFVDKRVVVTGRPWWPGRDVQHIMADHFEVTEVALADDELPWDPVPTEVPEPPTAASTAALAERGVGRWVRVVATLEAIEAGQRWPPAVLRLSDQSTLQVEAVRAGDAEPLLGQTVTAMGQVGQSPAGELMLVAPVAICPGDAARCGMEEGY